MTRRQEGESTGPAGARTTGRDGRSGAAGLQPLGLPRPIAVRADASGLPATVHPRGGRPLPVTRVEEVWRIAEEWWREAPLARSYYRVIVDGGRHLTLFHDDLTGPNQGWYEQRY